MKIGSFDENSFFVDLQLEAGEGAEEGEEGASSVISSDLPPAPSSSVLRLTLEKLLNFHLFNIGIEAENEKAEKKSNKNSSSK